MPFQTTVINRFQPNGVIGELAFEGPSRSMSYTLDTTTEINNSIGRAFTVKSEGIAEAGGTGILAGILVDPKSYAYAGLIETNASGETYALNGASVSMLEMGMIYVKLPAAAAIGDYVVYATATGILSTVTDPAIPGAGNLLIPNAVVYGFTVSEAGLACIKLTN